MQPATPRFSALDLIGLIAILLWIALSAVPMVANHFSTDLACKPLAKGGFRCLLHRRVFFDRIDFPARIEGQLLAIKHAGKVSRRTNDPIMRSGPSVLQLASEDGNAVRLEPIGVFVDTPALDLFQDEVNAGFDRRPPQAFSAKLIARNPLGWGGSVLVCLGLFFLVLFIAQRQKRWRGLQASSWDRMH